MDTIEADVVAARGGDVDAFARLVQGHAGAVCAITTAILGNPVAGEEVGQEVFVHAWQGLSKLRDPAQFGSWIRQIARNRSRGAVRSKARRREVEGTAITALPDPAPDAGARLDGARRESALWAALEELEEVHREVLVMFYREGQSVGQVARALELAEPTVRKRLSRARDRLRDSVEAQLGAQIARTAPRAAAVAAAVTAAIGALPAAAAHAATGGAPSPVPDASANVVPGSVPASGSVVPFKASTAALGVTAVAALLFAAAAATYAQLRSQLPEISPTDPPATVIAASVADDPTVRDRTLHEGGDQHLVAVRDEARGEVPDHVVHAFLAAEDVRFFEHGAVDLRAMGRAALHTATGNGRQGGSTLTQQLAKGMLADEMPDPTLRRKASEVVLAIELERRLSKEDILQRYLDRVYFGAGAYGIAEAARAYFDKPVEALTLAEGALLAGLVAGPTAYGPFSDPDRARARRTYVLDRMQANGWATPDEVATASQRPLPTRQR